MKKNVIIGILVLISVSASVFAYYQKTVAQRYRVLALENEIKAIEMNRVADAQRMVAEKQMRIAEISTMEALKQREIAVSQSQLAIKNTELARRQSKKAK